MIKKLTVVGNSLGLIIDRPILDLLEIDRETPLEIRTDGDALIVRPAGKAPKKERLRASAERLMDEHAETLKKLAK
jgi:antitoxin component of MazEF toxin-antitoxin module